MPGADQVERPIGGPEAAAVENPHQSGDAVGFTDQKIERREVTMTHHVRAVRWQGTQRRPESGGAVGVEKMPAPVQALGHPFVMVGESTSAATAVEDPILDLGRPQPPDQRHQVLRQRRGCRLRGGAGGLAGEPGLQRPGRGEGGAAVGHAARQRCREGAAHRERGHRLGLRLRLRPCDGEEREAGDQILPDTDDRVHRPDGGDRAEHRIAVFGERRGDQLAREREVDRVRSVVHRQNGRARPCLPIGVSSAVARSRPRPRRRCGGCRPRGSRGRLRSSRCRPRCARRCRGVRPAP